MAAATAVVLFGFCKEEGRGEEGRKGERRGAKGRGGRAKGGTERREVGEGSGEGEGAEIAQQKSRGSTKHPQSIQVL